MQEMKKLLKFITFVTAVVIGVCPANTSGTDRVLQFHGAVNVVDNEKWTSQPYPPTNGERTTATLPADFPLPCTTCDPGAQTEYCDYENGLCTKLSDEGIAYISTINGSLLYGSPFSLVGCTPRYLQVFSPTKLAVVCRDSSYSIFDFGSPPDQSDVAVYGEGGILVQLNNDEDIYHVEILAGYVLSVNHLRDSTPVHWSPPGCVRYSLSLHPLFTLNGLFIVSCLTAEGEHVYYMYPITHDTLTTLHLCGDPFSYSKHGNTFAVTCGNTMTVYMIADVSNSHSISFETNVTFRSYLDNNILLVVTGSQHHLVDVETFMSSSGLAGIHTINVTNCTFPLKLVAPGLYAMMCSNGTYYSVHLVSVANGDALTPVENLTTRPLDVYFHFEAPFSSTPPSTKTTPIPDVMPTPTSIINTPTTTVSLTSRATPSRQPESTVNVAPSEVSEPTDNVTDSPDTHIVIIITVTVASIIAFVIAVSLLIFWRCKHTHSKSGTPETQEVPLTCRSATYSPTNTASVWTH